MTESLQHLNEAIEFLKQIAPDVWVIYVKQQVISGWLMVAIPPLVALTLAALLYRLRFAKPGTEAWRLDEPYSRAWMFAAVLLAISVYVVLVTSPIGIMHIINPEYYAIRELLP